jgi:excinuclease ABC subunit A
LPLPERIVVRGAREHNLKNVTVAVPRDRLVVLTGVSGSGKSSFAFDTVYAEGQRRYVESLSSYARQFLGQRQRPAVDHISGLSPAIAIEQKSASRNPRSTVGTVTEVHDHLRVLYARVGEPHCPSCRRPVGAQAPQQVADRILAQPPGSRWLILALVVRGRRGEYDEVFARARRDGFSRVRVDRKVYSLREPPKLDKRHRHRIEIVVDRVELGEGIDRQRLAESVETALRFGEGALVLAPEGGAGEDVLLSERNACLYCRLSFDELTPQMFSFNNPAGACPGCSGLGTVPEIDPELVVPDPSKSIAEGAVAPWGRQDFAKRESWGERRNATVLEHHRIPWDVPFAELTAEQQEIVLFGRPEKLRVSWHDEKKGRWGARTIVWEGVIPRLRRHLKETKSDGAREWYLRFFARTTCPSCGGAKLRPEARAVTLGGRTIVEVERLSIADGLRFFERLELPEHERVIAEELLHEITSRLRFLMNVGLHYLTLDRAAPTLSGGEAQRIRLASQIGCGLVGVLYILDEPSIGLHQRDNGRLIRTLQELRDLGNTVLVVEHDEETIRSADWVIDFGPGAGVAGGHVVAVGTPAEVASSRASLTGRYLAGELRIALPARRRPPRGWLTVRGAREHNLKGPTVAFPLGVTTVVTGVSGSGKSTLVNQILYRALERDLMRASTKPGRHDGIEGLHQLDKVIAIDQQPIGRTPRSNPATYVGAWDGIRELFARLPEARVRGYREGRFSFNVRGGRCEACHGDGVKRIEMQFLADVVVPCELCRGRRFNRETLEVRWRGKSIADVLDLTVDEAVELFAAVPQVARPLEMLREVGLGYMHLGQSATTLSGGEAQRVKLARELCRPDTGRTLYILDEPTTGLHFADVDRLLGVLRRLVEQGNTVVVIEHNLEVIKTADWIVDLGPDGGEGGGRLVAAGTPEEVALSADSITGQYVREVLQLVLARAQGEPSGHAGRVRRSDDERGDALVRRGARADDGGA